MKTVTIPLEEYNRLLEINEKYKCLREYLEKANEILNSPGGELGSDTIKLVATKPNPKETKKQRIENYIKLIESGQRVKKPDHLKKK
jgi:hypothetical protein